MYVSSSHPLRPVVRERDVLSAVMAACAAHGVVIRRRNTGAMRNPAGRLVRFGRRGDSDLYGVVAVGPRRGTAVCVEVKKPGKWPTIDQIGRLMEMNNAGAIAFWVDDAEECYRVLDRVLQDECRVEVHPDGSQEIVSPDRLETQADDEIEERSR